LLSRYAVITIPDIAAAERLLLSASAAAFMRHACEYQYRVNGSSASASAELAPVPMRAGARRARCVHDIYYRHPHSCRAMNYY